MSAPNLDAILETLGEAMGSVSVMERSFPNDVMADQPDYKRACRAIGKDLAAVYGQLTDIQDGAEA
jgi:hypothetical protein